MDDPADVTTEALLEHSGWVRQLASRLVFDRDRVDDVVQQTWLTAVERPPAHRANLGAWLGRIVTNTVRRFDRGDARRAQRERVRSRPELTPSADELVVQAELHREVVSAVLKLDEPYRSTILLCYFHDHSPKRIAEMQGVPGATVRSRIKRGLEQLRDRLDRKLGGRAAWCAALFPAIPEAARSAVAVPGMFAMNKLVMSAVLPVAAVVGWVAWPSGEVPNITSDHHLATETTEPPRERSTAIEDLEAAGRAPLARREPTESKPAELALVGELLGRIVEDEAGTPIANVAVSCAGRFTRTDESGEYHLVGMPVGQRVEVLAKKGGFVPAGAFVTLPAQPTRHDLRLRRGDPVRVVVFDDASDTPVAGAQVRRQREKQPFARTDEDGQFLLHVVEGDRLALEVTAGGYLGTTWSWRIADTELVTAPRIPLVRPGWIEGTVTDADGQRLHGSWVFLANRAFARGAWYLDAMRRESLQLPGSVRFELLQPGRLDRPGAPAASELDASPSGRKTGDFIRVREEGSRERRILAGDVRPVIGGKTDEEGYFNIPVVPASTPYFAEAAAIDHVAVAAGPAVVAAPGQRVRVNIALRRGALIHGQVTRNGQPWQRGMVAWTHASGQRGGHVVPDDSGTYQLGGVPAGEVAVAIADRYDGPIGDPIRLSVESGRSYRQDFAYDENVSTISGRITDTDGQPLVDVMVSAHYEVGMSHTAYTRTDANGDYSLEATPPHTYEILVRRGPLSRTADDVSVGAEDVDFVLPAIGELTVKLVDAMTGEAIARSRRFSGIAWRESGAAEFVPLTARGGDDGIASLELPVGAVDLAVTLSGQGYRPVRLSGVTVAATGNAEPLVVELERGLDVKLVFDDPIRLEKLREARHLFFLLHDSQLDSLRGTFPAEGGGSNYNINGVYMWVGDPGVMSQRLGQVDSGIVRLRGQAPGRYTLKAYPDDIVFEPARFEVSRENRSFEIRWSSR